MQRTVRQTILKDNGIQEQQISKILIEAGNLVQC